MPSFNILIDPWIPARDKNETVKTYSLLDILSNAGNLMEITDNRSELEFGLYVFVCTFIMAAIKPQTPRAIEKMLKSGAFDKKAIDEYIKSCESNGVSFDLFDKTNPFLQEKPANWTDEEKKKYIKPVGELDPTIPTGNNALHFDHRIASEYPLTAAECMKLLCGIPRFTLWTPGHPAGINTTNIPLYMIAKGHNLFETLVRNLVPVSEYENYDNPGPYWEWKKGIKIISKPRKKTGKADKSDKAGSHVQEDIEQESISKTEKKRAEQPQEKKKLPDNVFPKTSLLFGLTFPPLKVTLIPNEDGNVLNVFAARGLELDRDAGWRDPYVAYVPKDKLVVAISSNNCNEQWMPIYSLYTPKYAADVIRQFEESADDEEGIVRLQYFGCRTNKAGYLLPLRGEKGLPKSVATNNIKMSYLESILSYVDLQHNFMKMDQATIVKKAGLQKRGTTAACFRQTEDQFYRKNKALVYSKVIPALINESENTLPDVDSIKKDIYKIRTEGIRQYINTLHLSIWQMEKITEFW